jgi:hypothetical protein
MDIRAYAAELTQRGMIAAEWVANNVDGEGNVPGGSLGNAYKFVFPLRITGYPVQASKVLNCIMKGYLTETCDLRDSKESKTNGTYTSYFCQAYPNGWIALGAFWLNRFDAFRTLMQGLMTNYYNEEIGSFRSACDPFTDEYDVTSAAMAGELFLLTDMEKAKRAGDFLIRHIENQPDLNKVYYARVDASFNYIKEPNPKSEMYSHVKIGAEGQALWMVGMPIPVLTMLYEATGEQKYMDGALRFFDAYVSCGDVIYRGLGSGKALWGASMLYRITQDKKYLDVAKGIADYFLSLQKDDGYFDPGPPSAAPAAAKNWKVLFDLTPEYARWFHEVSAELCGIHR